MFTRILLASDGSRDALQAAEAAGALAEKFGARLTVLHVYAPPLFLAASPIGVEPIFPDPIEAARQEDDVKAIVANRTCGALKRFDVAWKMRHENGHPAETIVRVAREERSDLIVLGSRGLSGVKAFLLGSVSDRVSHHAACSVLIVKPCGSGAEPSCADKEGKRQPQ